MDYRKIKRNAAAASLKPLPEGYARSVVGGVEVVTKPTVMSVPNKLSFMDNHAQDIEQGMEETARDYIGYVPDLSQSFEPDSSGFIGDYHVNDLMEQYEELKANSTPEEMDSMVSDMDLLNSGEFRSKFLKNGKEYAQGEEEDAIRMLGTSIKYGRGR